MDGGEYKRGTLVCYLAGIQRALRGIREDYYASYGRELKPFDLFEHSLETSDFLKRVNAKLRAVTRMGMARVDNEDHEALSPEEVLKIVDTLTRMPKDARWHTLR